MTKADAIALATKSKIWGLGRKLGVRTSQGERLPFKKAARHSDCVVFMRKVAADPPDFTLFAQFRGNF